MKSKQERKLDSYTFNRSDINTLSDMERLMPTLEARIRYLKHEKHPDYEDCLYNFIFLQYLLAIKRAQIENKAPNMLAIDVNIANFMETQKSINTAYCMAVSNFDEVEEG